MDQTGSWGPQRMHEMGKTATACESNVLLLGCKTLGVSLNFMQLQEGCGVGSKALRL
jgi:hypothetical protein